ncbi:MAG: two-component system response regulator CreB [Gammaproteobacteria bacterium]|nr:two-component system response regulator CreB [Gammaproteobacteria bacterium]
MDKSIIILIEDEPAIADTVTYALESEGFTVEWRNTAHEGLELIQSSGANLVILDIGLPDMNGFDVFRKLRALSSVPVIFLTARNVEIDRVSGLEMGADDYVVKPFSPRELTARVRAVLRRSLQTGSVSVDSCGPEVGPFLIDTRAWTVTYHGKNLDLTRHEFGILALLLKHPGQVFSREQLLSHVWDEPEHRLDRTVDAHVKNIRFKLRKIDNQSDSIKTKRGVGYFFSSQK